MRELTMQETELVSGGNFWGDLLIAIGNLINFFF
jgi:hypothetical protein